jgi:EAL domain-containing protein (putative c-di-GMP-specific phosphodiesterase class I)/GGDEF domain-containing protein
VVTLAPDVSGLERWSTVSTFLSALSEALGARVSCYVPTAADAAPSRSHPGTGVSNADLAALERIARQWQGERSGVDHGDTGRVSPSGLGVVDLAVVRGHTGDPHGVLVVLRSVNDRTDRSTAAAEMDLAASLVPSVLDTTIPATARQALIDWAAGQCGPRVAFAISVDRLGATNEVLGYRAGDTVLRSLIGRIEFWAGPHGRVARGGGARYLVIRTDLADEAEALREVERLRELIAEPVLVGGIAISRSASVGVSVDPAASLAPDALLWGASRAGAAARADGGDSVRVYSEDGAAGRVTRLQLDLELSGALSAGELRIHYQPEFDLRTGAIVALEALLRWQHPKRGLLSADAFVPESEQTRTFVAVQRWVIETTCQELARWRAAGLAEDLVLRINVQAPQVLHGGVTAVLLDALEHNGLLGTQLCIELTERRMPAELDLLAAELTTWREHGISVAVDDFGTGEGTLSHLQLLPIDILKVDQRFVGPMAQDARAAAIVAGVVALARSLDLEVVAEGVSGPRVSEALLALGCERGQGNGLAEAMPPDRIAELLALQVLPHSDAG